MTTPQGQEHFLQQAELFIIRGIPDPPSVERRPLFNLDLVRGPQALTGCRETWFTSGKDVPTIRASGRRHSTEY